MQQQFMYWKPNESANAVQVFVFCNNGQRSHAIVKEWGVEGWSLGEAVHNISNDSLSSNPS